MFAYRTSVAKFISVQTGTGTFCFKAALIFQASNRNVFNVGRAVTIVLQSDAKAAIIADFGKWAQVNSRVPASAEDTRIFYGLLQANKRYLLEFRHPNPDKWQVVHSWLSGAGLVAD